VAQLEDTTVGGDFMFLFGENYFLRGSLARSDRPGVEEGNWFGSFSFTHSADLVDVVLSYDDIGANFDPGIGFVRRPDQRRLRGNFHYKPRPGWPGVRQLIFGYFFERVENHSGVLETETNRPGFVVTFDTMDFFMLLYFDSHDRIPFAYPIAPGVLITADEYKNRYVVLEFTSNPARKLSVYANSTIGSYYDGDRFSVFSSLLYKPIPRLRLSGSVNYDDIEVPGGQFTSTIYTFQSSYYFSPTLTSRVAVQYSTLLEDFIFNFRIRWIYAPGSEAWLVYDEGRRFGTADPSLRDRALILKIVYNFHF